MGRRDVIRILILLAGLFWLTIVVMPRRFAIIDDFNTCYYDKMMASQEFTIRKELKSSENKLAPEEIKLDSREMLAKNLWATFKAQDAASMLRDVIAEREKLNKKYNQKTVNTMIVLAGVYRDLNQLEESAFWYRKAWHLDLENLPADDVRLMRDETNFAVLDYLRGDIETDKVKRQQCFKDSLIHIQQAIEIWHKQKSADTAALANLLYLQYLSYREIGNISASRQSFGEMKYLNRQLKRTYKLPWK